MEQRERERGIALIGIIVVTALLMSLAVAMTLSVNSDTQLRGAFGHAVTGFYAAEAGLNKGMGDYKNIFLDFGIPDGSDFSANVYTVGTRTTTYQMSPSARMLNNCGSGQTPPCPASVTIPAGELFGGLNALQYTYTVNSAAGVGEDVEAAVGAEFLVGYIPLFQFVAFYRDDLEIAPGPEMNLNGRVHTNSDLYLAADSGPLRISDNPAANVFSIQVTAGGNIYRGRKRQNICQGTVVIDMIEDLVAPDDDLDPKTLPCSGGSTELKTPAELAQWKGSIKAEIQNIAIPEPDIIDRGSGEFWQKADLRIVLNATVAPPVFEVQSASGLPDPVLTAQLLAFMNATNWNTGAIAGQGPSTMPGVYSLFYTAVPTLCGNHQDPNCYVPAFSSANRIYASDMIAMDGALRDFRRGGFFNFRENKWILMLNINVADLIRWNAQNGQPFFSTTDTSDGGLVIFASIQGPDSELNANNYAVRVFGSANLPLPGGVGVSADPTGVTFVTDQALYVLGDYNRGPLFAGDLPRQPAALIGDSVNVLSNNYWTAGCPLPCTRNDAQSVLPLGNALRNASITRINAAFLGGVDETPDGFLGPSSYNGGLENYPRFHESWSGQALNYQGSFVSLGTPAHVNGMWCGTGGACNIYNPPVRNWNFDPSFNDAANLPPLTPRFVYVQQVLFTEDFK
jgi:hypothetical protein